MPPPCDAQSRRPQCAAQNRRTCLDISSLSTKNNIVSCAFFLKPLNKKQKSIFL